MAVSVPLTMETIRALCPFLRDMAARTNTVVDDLVVNFICNLVGASDDDTSDKREEL
jgi:hypothetical protein